jgi:ribosome biogenesis protein ERB1
VQVRSLSCDPTGQWLLSGSDDGTVRLWEVMTGHCRTSWDLGAKVHCVAWCPDMATRLVSCVLENKVVLLASGVGGAAVAEAAAAALQPPPVDAAAERVLTRWVAREGGGLEVVHQHQLRSIAWHARCAPCGLLQPLNAHAVPIAAASNACAHVSTGATRRACRPPRRRAVPLHMPPVCRGDYFATVAPAGATMSVVVHQLSKQVSQNPFRKNRGRITCTTFHPTKPLFLVATQNNVRIYNLAKQTLVKKLLAGGGVISSISVHSSGDHVLLGTEDNRCLWCVAPSLHHLPASAYTAA